MEKYILIPADDSLPVRYVELDETRFCEEVYRLIDCDCFECVYITPRSMFIVDESGKLKSPPKPVNSLASKFYPGTRYGEPIVGDVLFAFEGIRDGEPDIVPVPSHLASYYEDFFGLQK